MNDKRDGPRVYGVRGSQLGDCLVASVVLNWLRQRWPNAYIHYQIARKHAPALLPLLANHKHIDQLVITDCTEGMGPRDRAIAATCDIVFNPMPEHPHPGPWVNDRNIWEETWIMAGLPLNEYHAMSVDDQRAELTQWFEVERKSKRSIALFPAAQYGAVQDWHPRNARWEWFNVLVARLRAEGYTVYQLGHPNDFLDRPSLCQDLRGLSYLDQIRFALGCDLSINTDSGTGLVLGAYKTNQISLLTNHMKGWIKNYTALATNNPNNRSFVGLGCADNISIDEVIGSVKEMTS